VAASRAGLATPISGVDWPARTLRSGVALTVRPAVDLALT
jgi:hypothetical protein